jgi:hypothetical protein
MTASANFEVKGTIHLVFFGTVNAGQVFGHVELLIDGLMNE